VPARWIKFVCEEKDCDFETQSLTKAQMHMLGTASYDFGTSFDGHKVVPAEVDSEPLSGSDQAR
jgi:hypothetical protein